MNTYSFFDLMKNLISKLYNRLKIIKSLPYLLEKASSSNDTQLRDIQLQLDSIQHSLISQNKTNDEVCNVLFICHRPSLWGKQKPVYEALSASPNFNVTLLATPGSHIAGGNRHEYDYMREYFEQESLEFINAYDSNNESWVYPQSLEPHYVFLQTPYFSHTEEIYTAQYISRFAKVCYLPYVGILVQRGAVEDAIHRPDFFRFAQMLFLPDKIAKTTALKKCSDTPPNNIYVTGSPIIDSLKVDQLPASKGIWSAAKSSFKVLWTPRWNTYDNTCLFFEYKDILAEYATKNPDIELALRHHPSALGHLAKTGEFTSKEQEMYHSKIENIPNMHRDVRGEYQDSFLHSDVLISDISSMMSEYFVTGKPLIFTHRTELFSEFGKEIAKGFYWVNDQKELTDTLNMLKSGKDPLKETRQQIISEIYFNPENGVANHIASLIIEDFRST